MISDARTPDQQNTIIARRGTLIPDESSNQLTLRLFDGSIFGVDPKTNASHVTSFNTYDLAIMPSEAFGATWLSPDEMSYPTLMATIRDGRTSGKRNYEAETELARKYMIPIATLLFALLGSIAGPQTRARRAIGTLRRQRRAVFLLLFADAGGTDARRARRP